MNQAALAKPNRFDLATREGRKRAEADLLWGDHGFLRAAFSNFHWISPEMARANQPSPKQLARYAEMGFKTILNVRGPSKTGYYALEKEACEKLGLALVDQRMFSREPPRKEQVHQAKAIFDSIAYPALIHCKSGADRAGVMAALYMHLRAGKPVKEAAQQLSLKFLHVRHGKTGVLDYFFERYLAETKDNGKSLLDWVDQDYDPIALRADFKASWLGDVLVDKILRRE